MIQASVYGHLGRDPEQRETRNGSTMAIASAAVGVGRPGHDDITEWVSVIAFGTAAETLLRHHKGDFLAVMGPMRKGHFLGRDGLERDSWSVTAESIVSARKTRPRGGRKRLDRAAKPASSLTNRTREDLNDEIPF